MSVHTQVNTQVTNVPMDGDSSSSRMEAMSLGAGSLTANEVTGCIDTATVLTTNTITRC